MATLMLTNACNLKCKYCFIIKQKGQMSLETAKKAIDLTYQNLLYHQLSKTSPLRKNKKITINFLGGEPLLLYNKIIKPCIEYGKQKYKNKIRFSITTNGVLLSPEISDFLIKNDTHITFSIDGNEDIQNFNRPAYNIQNYYNILINNLKYLIKKYPKKFLVRTTIYSKNISSLYNSYLFFDNLGVKNFSFFPDTTSLKWTDNEITQLEKEINKICFYRYQQSINNQISMNNDLFNQLLSDGFLTLKYKNNLQDIKLLKNKNRQNIYRCGLGILTWIINMNGDIYSCVTQTNPQDNNSIYLLGNIYNENKVDIKQHVKLLNIYQEQIYKNNLNIYEECQKCIYSYVCLHRTSSCLTIGYNTHNLFNIKPEEPGCKFIETIYKNSLILIKYQESPILTFEEYNNILQNFNLLSFLK